MEHFVKMNRRVLAIEKAQKEDKHEIESLKSLIEEKQEQISQLLENALIANQTIKSQSEQIVNNTEEIANNEASVEEIKILSGWCHSPDIKKGELTKEYQNWGKAFLIEFDIVVNKLPNGEWMNVFHFTGNKKDCCGLGDRIPALFINKGGYFHFTTALDDDGNNQKNINFVLETIYHVTIQQSNIDSKYWYEIIMNNESKLKKENMNPKSYSTVRFYNSDPWFDSFTYEFGHICNLEIQNTDF